jgi:uncharacterized protein YidB (DUF937 family)
MNVDVSKIVEALGDSAVAQIGESVGLDGGSTSKVVKSLSGHFKAGGNVAQRVASDTGLREEVISQFTDKLVEAGKEKLLSQGPVADALASAGPVGGLVGRLFGKK